MAQAVRVLMALGIPFEEHPFGGSAIDGWRKPLPDQTLEACRVADAVLVGAVGGPQWDASTKRPEQGLIRLRKELDVYANLRPAVAEGVDLVIVRELVGGLYYGGSGRLEDGRVFDTCVYTEPEVERVARRAFELGRDEPEPARSLEAAVDAALEQAPTPDVGGTATTSEFGDAVLASLEVAVP